MIIYILEKSNFSYCHRSRHVCCCCNRTWNNRIKRGTSVFFRTQSALLRATTCYTKSKPSCPLCRNWIVLMARCVMCCTVMSRTLLYCAVPDCSAQANTATYISRSLSILARHLFDPCTVGAVEICLHTCLDCHTERNHILRNVLLLKNEHNQLSCTHFRIGQ